MMPIVFIGPSLYPIEPAQFPDVEFRPPAAKGDLARACMQGAGVLCLVDGIFETKASVWHKEILYAIDHGAIVIGGASMGALRAAECAQYGMIGVGGIFVDFAIGRLFSDADVAVLHAPAELNYQPLSSSLIDALATIDNLRANRVVSSTEAVALRGAARGIHFKNRDWKTVVERSRIHDDRAEVILQATKKYLVNRKQSDALKLIELVSDDRYISQHEKKLKQYRSQNTAFINNLLIHIGNE